MKVLSRGELWLIESMCFRKEVSWYRETCLILKVILELEVLPTG